LHAAAAGGDAGSEDAVADRDRGDGLSHFGDRADRFVAEDRPRSHRWHVALENVQVAAADGAGVDPDDDVGRGFERWVGHFLPLTRIGTVEHESLHGVSFGFFDSASRAPSAGQGFTAVLAAELRTSAGGRGSSGQRCNVQVR